MPSTFAGQASLPRLPVPALSDTAERYVRSVHPLTTFDEFVQVQKQAEAFVTDENTQQAQQALQRRAASEESTWLDSWWTNGAYLEVRDPLPFATNFWFYFEKRPGTQLERAARLTRGVLDFHEQLRREMLPAETLRGAPVCMNQFRYLFGLCRMPRLGRDVMVQAADSDYIVVMRRNHLYKVFAEISDHADAAPAAPAIGVFTCLDRDTWAGIQTELIDTAASNETVIDTVAKALFMVCLDDTDPQYLLTDSDIVHALAHGQHGGGNRWHDKSLQLIVLPTGDAGFHGEHTMADAPPVLSCCTHVHRVEGDAALMAREDGVGAEMVHMPQWVLAARVGARIAEAAAAVLKVAGNLDVHVEHFSEFGAAAIKKVKTSPDAFVQVAMQLAVYRALGELRATYETASTRRFYKSRTETIRSLTPEAAAFVVAMRTHPHAAATAALLRAATAAHAKQSARCNTGQGIDRHLYGLKMMSKELNLPLCAMLRDPVCARSCAWALSTSQVSLPFHAVAGYVPAVKEGLGFCYNVLPHAIRAHISSTESVPGRNARVLATAFADALRDCMLLAQMYAPAKM